VGEGTGVIVEMTVLEGVFVDKGVCDTEGEDDGVGNFVGVDVSCWDTEVDVMAIAVMAACCSIEGLQADSINNIQKDKTTVLRVITTKNFSTNFSDEMDLVAYIL